MGIAFIGFGEAAYELAAGLTRDGMDDIYAFDTQHDHPLYGKIVQDRVKQANVTLLDSAIKVLEHAKIVIIAVPVDKTYQVYETIKPHLKTDTVYIDLTASLPNVKKEIADQLNKIGVKFIDAAIMGPVVVHKHKVPIYMSGDDVETIKEYFNGYGMNIQEVNNIAGSASAIKLIRSIYMKGVSALLLEMAEAANEFGVADLVIDSLGNTLDEKSFKETMNRLITGTAIHSFRRSKELEGTIEMLESAGLNASMSKTSKEKLESFSETNIKEAFKGEVPHSWIEVIRFLENK